MKYLGYESKERKKGKRKKIQEKIVEKIIKEEGERRVLKIDIKDGKIKGFFDIKKENIYEVKVIERDVKENYEKGN